MTIEHKLSLWRWIIAEHALVFGSGMYLHDKPLLVLGALGIVIFGWLSYRLPIESQPQNES